MRTIPALLLLPLVAACGAAVGDTGAEGTARRIEVNEALAVSHLKSLVSAQVQAQALCVIDADGDGIGEFAFASELSGAREPRTRGAGLKMPLLAGELRRLGTKGFLEAHGYLFRVFLPGADGLYVGEGAESASEVWADEAEKSWFCYAWPSSYGETGVHTFLVDVTGTVRCADVPTISGPAAPDAGAGLVIGEGLEFEHRPDWSEVP